MAICFLPQPLTSLFSVKLPPLTKHPIPPSIKKEQNKNPKQDKIHKRIRKTKQTKPIHIQIKVQILMENQLHKQTFHHQQTFLQSQLKLHTFFFLFSCLLINSSANSYMFIYGGCSQDKYQPDSPFETNLNSLLSSIVSSSSQSSYNSFAVGNGTSSAPLDAPAAAAVPAYGLYQCRGDLKISECSSCVQNAVGQIHLVCPSAYAAGLELDGCFIRYENVDFLGKLDTSILYKKCSRSTSNDVEFFKRRDDVLADLESTTSFRVSSLGLVEGFAQCLGDLNPNDCSSCISDAVGKLKNICGSASAADVYLGQCYARYWASGYYGSREDSSSEDQVGKTVAIIAGTLAGLALIVVLLSFCRKAMG